VELLDLFDGHFDGALDAPFESGRLAPAATVLTPSRKMACASTVAVVVPSPATSEVLEATSRTICAPMFSKGSREFDFFCHRHAVLGDDRRAELLFDHRVATLGAKGDLYCVGEGIHATQNRLAGILTCYNLLAILFIPLIFCLRNSDENCTGRKAATTAA